MIVEEQIPRQLASRDHQVPTEKLHHTQIQATLALAGRKWSQCLSCISFIKEGPLMNITCEYKMHRKRTKSRLDGLNPLTISAELFISIKHCTIITRTYQPTRCPTLDRWSCRHKPTWHQPEQLDLANQSNSTDSEPPIVSCESISGQALAQSNPRPRIS